MLRTIARHIAGAIVGIFGTWLITTMTSLGISPEEAAGAVENIESIIIIGILVALYAITEKGLKLVKPIFPGDWAEEVWKRLAGSKLKGMTSRAAENKIDRGEV